MQVADFVLYTLDGDTANPPSTYVAEILSIDAVNSFFTCSLVDSGQKLTVKFSDNTSGPWQGDDGQGNSVSLATHDVYTGGGTDPVAQAAALVTFADNKRYLCEVQSISPSTDVVFYQQPYPKLSFDENSAITQSDWDAYPVGGQILSIEGCVINNELIQPANAGDAGAFADGWWSLATRRPAFSTRLGPNINPYAVVVHTTDMPPLTLKGASTMAGLVNRWTTETGKGDCAHFIIGRDAAAGVVQLAPITRNASHAGAADKINDDGTHVVLHGWFVTGDNKDHPNSVSVGIELHCAGILRKIGDQWWYAERDPQGQYASQGKAIPDADVVFPDAANPDQGYHSVTDYQYQQLRLLLDGLETVLAALPNGCVAWSKEPAPAWGTFTTGRNVGHVSLDAANRGDPWPATCAWMKTRTP